VPGPDPRGRSRFVRSGARRSSEHDPDSKRPPCGAPKANVAPIYHGVGAPHPGRRPTSCRAQSVRLLGADAPLPQYIGHEVVATRRLRNGRRARHPAETRLLGEAVAGRAGRYRQRYGDVPRYKAGPRGRGRTGQGRDAAKAPRPHRHTVNMAVRVDGPCQALESPKGPPSPPILIGVGPLRVCPRRPGPPPGGRGSAC